MDVRRAQASDRDRLLEVWERSVRATHRFLAESDVLALRPLVAQELASNALDWWVLEASGVPIGFLGYAENTIEALFIDRDHRGKGGGKRLVAHAQALAGGALSVDVNEQNDDALEFYRGLGFEVVGRSPTDGGGRPFPLLHMRRAAPTTV
jgi:putative acetyltransferase